MRRLMLGIAFAVTSLIPVMGMADDQQIADFIKGRLQAEQKQGNLRGFNVDMRVEQGTVWFKGHVSNSAQEMTILKTAQAAGHLGVVKVVDDIESRASQAPVQSAFRSAGYEPQPQFQEPSFDRSTLEQPPAFQSRGFRQPSPLQQASPFRKASSPQDLYGSYGGEIVGDFVGGGEILGDYVGGGPISGDFGAPISGDFGGGQIISGDPLPFATAGGGQPFAGGPSGGISESPDLPGYAWPGYAASPNYGAVAYPRQHSASAWPYIGPFYPYPQVPLGWRKVSLEWDDGFWHLDFHDK